MNRKIISIVFVSIVFFALIFLKIPYSSTYQYSYNRSLNEIRGDLEAGQIFTSVRSDLASVSFQFATYGDRKNDRDVIFEIRRKYTDKEPLRKVVVKSSNLTDHRFYEFKFPVVTDAKGKEFYASVRSPESAEGNAVTIDYFNSDSYGGEKNALVVLSRDKNNKITGQNIIKKNSETAFKISHRIPAGEFIARTVIRKFNEFIRSLRTNSGDYLKSSRFLFFSFLVAFIIPLSNQITVFFQSRKKAVILLLLFMVAGAGIRLIYLNKMPYTNDEGFYLYDARTLLQGSLPGGDALAKSPIFVLLTSTFIAIFGNILKAGRYVSLILGVISALPLYYLASNLKDRKAGIIASSMWLFSGAPALFTIYGHTQTTQIFLATSTLALVTLATRNPKWYWFFAAGGFLGLAQVSRKSSIALIIPIIFILLLNSVFRKELFKRLAWGAAGFATVVTIFLSLIFKLYGSVGVYYAMGVSLAKASFEQFDARVSVINDVLPFFREAYPLVFLALIFIGFFLELILKERPTIMSRFSWFIPVSIAAASNAFVQNNENSMRLEGGVGLFWQLIPFFLIIIALLPRSSAKDSLTQKNNQVLTPIVWFMATVIIYAAWIKFRANYIAEFLPALVLAAGIGGAYFAEYYKWENLKGKFPKVIYYLFLMVFFWGSFGAMQNAYKFDHTGTFHWSSISEAASYLQKNANQKELISTGALAIPYLSGHHVPYDAAHSTWYAYGFIEPELRNVFMASAEDMQEKFLHETNWFVRDKITEFSFFLEYPKIKSDVENNFEEVLEIENYSNPIRIYRRIMR